MGRIRKALQHACNSLHLYCRLREARIPANAAKLIARCWAIVVKWLIYSE